MPAYLCHGFRWHRRSIRVYVVVQNLDDASPEWIIPARSSRCMLESFYSLFEFLPYCVPPSSRSSGRASSGVLRIGSGSADGSDDDDSYVYNTSAYTTTAATTPNSYNDFVSGGGMPPTPNGRSRSSSLTQTTRSTSRPRSRKESNPPPPQPTSRPPPPPPGTNGYGYGRGSVAVAEEPHDDIRAQDWSVVKLLEEYDPLNLDEVSRPYAYVADYVVRVDLSASIVEEIQRYEDRARADPDPPMTGPRSDETGRAASAGSPNTKRGTSTRRGGGSGGGSGWLEKLRDQLQRGEDIRWYVVVNGDEVRDWPDEPERKTDQIREHHAQYSQQQLVFEKQGPRGPGPVAPLPPPPLVRPMFMDKELPPLRTKMSLDGGGLRPKTPSKGGLRRLFGRTKTGDMSP